MKPAVTASLIVIGLVVVSATNYAFQKFPIVDAETIL